MLELGIIVLFLVVAIALIFDYINGFNDSANAIATCVSTRALSIRTAVVMAAILNFIGAIISTKVATTIGKGIVDPGSITQTVILAGLLSAIIWGIITWYFAIPSSSSHALVGGISGAVVAHLNFHALHWVGLKKIILSLILSPIIGMLCAIFFMILLFWVFRRGAPSTLNKAFKKMQILSAAVMSLAHGTADAQKSMGVIAMALLSFGMISSFYVPYWVIICCASAMALGTAIGGWRIIKTVGSDFVKLDPVHGFCVQTVSAGVILAASSLGLPTSTTHVVTSSILGVGLTRRSGTIDWRIGFRILLAWGITIPASATLAFLIYDLIHLVFGK
jgi:inorganic phosphate transporter, PiT family